MERLEIFTDRSTYIAGEDILFRVMNLSPSELIEPQWSKIVYIELFTEDQHALIRRKFRLGEKGCSGSLHIPESPPSGMYLLKVYTKWMRNFPPEKYAFSHVRIINPNSPDVSGPLLERSDTAQGTIQVRDSVTPAFPSVDGIRSAGIRTERSVYPARSKVQLEGYLDGSIQAELCLSVIRKEAVDLTSDRNIVKDPGFANIPGQAENEIFIPETRGMVISGKVVASSGGAPLANARVHLSLIGKSPDYFGYLTGKDGRFYFALPDYTGWKDFFISAETGGQEKLDILVDQDFCSRKANLTVRGFRIREDEKAFLKEMLINAQLAAVFAEDTIPGYPAESTESETLKDSMATPYFYGEPAYRIRIDEYVRLPTVEEFIYELVPQTVVRRRGGRPYLVILGEDTDLAIYSPLVLLDHVVITDLSTLINVSPEKLESIDLVNSTYIRGDIKFGGILSIASKNRDLAGIDLPAGSYFFNFENLSLSPELTWPDYTTDQGNLRHPDFRNTIYWDADLKVDPDGHYSAEFFTSDLEGEFMILVRGFTYLFR